jgi:hypothetical protein
MPRNLLLLLPVLPPVLSLLLPNLRILLHSVLVQALLLPPVLLPVLSLLLLNLPILLHSVLV